MKRIFLYLYLTFSLYSSLQAAEERFIYTKISTREGLASTINSIYKEPDGDVWLGTPKGLFTFNGHDLKHHNDSLFLNRVVNEIEEDKEGNIWVLTDNWLMLKAKGKEGFKHVKAGATQEKISFYGLCNDKEGIWFGSRGSIYRYTYKDRKLSLYRDLEGWDTSINLFMNMIDDSTLLYSSNQGSLLINTQTGEISETQLGPIKEVSGTMTDSQGRLWIAFYNHGIRVLDKEGNLLKSYTSQNSALSNDIVICFTEKDSKIWAGTDGGGINIIDPETDKIRVLSHIAGDPSSFPAHSIKNLHTDNYGNIWAGSTRDGLFRISPSGMKTYGESHIGISSGLSNPSVLSLFQEDDDHVIWIGTDGEGVNKFDPKVNRFTHYPQTLKTKIVSMATYSDTEIAMSVYADGIWLLNKKTGAMRPMPINDEEIKYFMKYTGKSLVIVNGKNNDIYFLRSFVQRYDKKTGSCIPVPFEDGDVPNGNMYVIGESEKGLYLHDMNSIYMIDEEAGNIKRLNSADDYVINSGYLGQNGDIWLATNHGLYRFNEYTQESIHIETDLFQNVSAVVCDYQSRIWMGVGSILYAYLSDEDSFAMFGESDGASPNEYMSKPRLLSREGNVYIGGVQGLLSVESDYTIDASEEPQLKLYTISADKQRIYADKHGIYEVPRNSKFVSISVSTQEVDIFRQKMYRFTLVGSGKKYEQMSPSIEIQNIPEPGKYDLLVSCTKRNGDWTEPANIMTIKIPRPWYLSGWFLIGMFITLLVIVGSILISLMYRKASRLKLALKEQEQMVYEEKVQFLINISHELRTPLTLIMAPLKRLLNSMNPQDEQYPTLSRAYRQSRRMRDLLNMVLDLRKMEEGKNSLRIESSDFNQWVLNATEDIINEEHAEHIEILRFLDPEIGHAEFDKTKCDTVLTNILMNAIKHSRPGDTIVISTSLTEEGMVRTCISDEGPGLKDVDPEKMFTRFYQSNNEQYGSGIGLSYSKILVELHEGRIGAMNNPDRGATFWWEIPVKSSINVNDTPAKAYLNELIGQELNDNAIIPESTYFNTSEMKIMLVDDNQDLLDFLKESISAEFAEIYTTTSGNKAMALLCSGKTPDIIISDVNMPDGDGYTFCKKLKQDDKYNHIPVILLTARGEQQSQSDSYKAGADAYMAKPFETDTLVELIRNLLRRKDDIRRKYLDTEGDAKCSYGSDKESFILRLNKIISENISNPDLDQQLICRELCVSRALLYNKMKSITGGGTKEYITRIRIEKAKSLIENSSYTIAEISDMTGFASQSYFSTAFKSATGVTPSQYKQEKRKLKE